MKDIYLKIQACSHPLQSKSRKKELQAEQETGECGTGDGNAADIFISWWESPKVRLFFFEFRDDDFKEFIQFK